MKLKSIALPVVISAALSLVCSAGACYYLTGMKEAPLNPSLVACSILFALALPYFLMIFPSVQFVVAAALRSWRWSLAAFPAYTVLLLAIFMVGTNTVSFQGLLRLSTFLLIPLFLVSFAQKLGRKVNAFDFFALASLWLPFDLGLLKSTWMFPQGEGAYLLNAMIAVSYAICLFHCFRNIKHIGCKPQFDSLTFRDALIGLTLFCAIALPIGTLTGFIHYNGVVLPWKALTALCGILFFIALPEELLFRGLLQNFFMQKLKNEKLALPITALIFGASHLNNGPSPDWRYFLLATLAGLVYGHAYQRRRNLTASILIHAGVDAIWFGYFM